jgi:hypothetical protein
MIRGSIRLGRGATASSTSCSKKSATFESIESSEADSSLPLDLDDLNALAAQRRVDLRFAGRIHLAAHGLAGALRADPGEAEFLDVAIVFPRIPSPPGASCSRNRTGAGNCWWPRLNLPY